MGRTSESELMSIVKKEWNGTIVLIAVGEDHCIAATGKLLVTIYHTTDFYLFNYSFYLFYLFILFNFFI